VYWGSEGIAPLILYSSKEIKLGIASSYSLTNRHAFHCCRTSVDSGVTCFYGCEKTELT